MRLRSSVNNQFDFIQVLFIFLKVRRPGDKDKNKSFTIAPKRYLRRRVLCNFQMQMLLSLKVLEQS
jgi:hypothetical protein